eukprot:6202029-Pleurochrysis_carterae.AAC.3
MITLILKTITCPAARRSYALSSNGIGRELLRTLAADASAASSATSATIAALLHSQEVRGVAEPCHCFQCLRTFFATIESIATCLCPASRH